MIKLLSLTAKGFKHLNINKLEFPERGNILIVGNFLHIIPTKQLFH